MPDPQHAPWPDDPNDNPHHDLTGERGGPAFADLYAAQRLLQDRLAGASLPSDIARDVTARLAAVSDIVAEHQVPEPDRVDGWRSDLPGRGMALMPAYVIEHEQDGRLRGRVSFGRYFLGGNAAAHGGTPPLLFDDVLGRVANHALPGVARTAYLHVNYRKIIPIDAELRFEASRDRIDGRKRYASARILDAEGTVLTDCEALFVQLRPGQP